MRISVIPRRAAGFMALASLAWLGACGSVPQGGNSFACMTRVMYFESNRSSDEGMLAVGTVVMNRVESREFPDNVCGVVGQKNQFAPGVLSRPMKEGKSQARAERMARKVIGGRRHRGVGDAKYFHTAGRTYRYKNMHYVLVAGGNAFYTRDSKGDRRYIPRTQIAAAGQKTSIEAPHRFGRSIRREQRPLLAAVQQPAVPRPTAQAQEQTIEQLIIASAGW
jgi:spore germination cell wall hydrolase CwlJ-like protein